MATNYLICTTHRSGSNLLCEVLTRTGVAGRPGEYFSDQVGPWLAEKLGLPPNLEGVDLFRQLIQTTTINGVFGAKMMQRHLKSTLTTLRRELALPEPMSDHEVLLALLPSVRYIWLVREDIVRQAISLFRAKQSNSWMANEDATSQPIFEFEKIDECASQLQRSNQRWEQWFASQSISPLRVTYESLTSDYRSIVKAILAHIGVSVAARIQPPTVKRQGDSLSDDWADRYSRMKKSL